MFKIGKTEFFLILWFLVTCALCCRKKHCKLSLLSIDLHTIDQKKVSKGTVSITRSEIYMRIGSLEQTVKLCLCPCVRFRARWVVSWLIIACWIASLCPCVAFRVRCVVSWLIIACWIASLCPCVAFRARWVQGAETSCVRVY